MIKGNSRTIGYVECQQAKLSQPGHGFFETELTLGAAGQLEAALEECGAGGPRDWFTAAMTSDNLARLRVIRNNTPAYELNAAESYVRGDVFRVSGSKRSVNIDFSRTGAGLILASLRPAIARAKEYVLLRIPSRNRDVIEFIPDTEIADVIEIELAKLALAGEALAGAVWSADDFSDWEG